LFQPPSSSFSSPTQSRIQVIARSCAHALCAPVHTATVCNEPTSCRLSRNSANVQAPDACCRNTSSHRNPPHALQPSQSSSSVSIICQLLEQLVGSPDLLLTRLGNQLHVRRTLVPTFSLHGVPETCTLRVCPSQVLCPPTNIRFRAAFGRVCCVGARRKRKH
jgi:hypothetical protein